MPTPAISTLRRPATLLLVLLMSVVAFAAMAGATSETTARAHAAMLTFRQKAVVIASYQRGLSRTR